MDVRGLEGADDVHVQEVTAVRRRVELAAVREPRGVGGHTVVAMGVACLGEGGGGIGGAVGKLPEAVDADVKAAVQHGSGGVGGEGGDVRVGARAVHTGFVPREARGSGGGGRGGRRDEDRLDRASRARAAVDRGDGDGGRGDSGGASGAPARSELRERRRRRPRLVCIAEFVDPTAGPDLDVPDKETVTLDEGKAEGDGVAAGHGGLDLADVSEPSVEP